MLDSKIMAGIAFRRVVEQLRDDFDIDAIFIQLTAKRLTKRVRSQFGHQFFVAGFTRDSLQHLIKAMHGEVTVLAAGKQPIVIVFEVQLV